MLEDSIKVSRLSSTVILTAITLFFAASIIWFFFGTISDKAYVKGVVFPVDQTVGVNVPNSGFVKNLFVINSQQVEAGDPLALVAIGSAYSVLSSPCSGIVMSYKNSNDSFQAFEDIVTILPSESKGIVHSIVAFTDFETSRNLRPGMEIQATPSNETRERIGYVKGKISGLSQYPVSRQEAILKLDSEAIVSEIFPDGKSVFWVDMEMGMSGSGPGGLDWSFPLEESIDMGVGTFCDIQIIVKSRSMYNYLLESIKKTRNKVRMQL